MAVDATPERTSFLTHIWVDITSKCNNRCPYCYDMGNNNSDVELPKLQEIFRLLKQLAPPNIILIGGEPTLHKNFEDIIRLANEICKPMIVTNGTMFSKSDFCEKIFKFGVGGVLFSLTSPYEETHDNITKRKGSYKELIQGIHNSLEFLSPQQIRTSTTITKDNYLYLRDVVDLNRSLGLFRTVFNACVPSIADVEGNSCLPLNDLASIIEDLYIYCRELHHSIKIATNLPYCIFDEKIRDELRTNQVIYTGTCQLYRGSGYEFLSSGEIIPCTHLHDCVVENPIAKHMNGAEFFECINSEKMVSFRKQFWRYPAKACRFCREWGKCVGGCPIMWNAFDPNDFLTPIS
ncbi:radical SAM protein [bacterium 1xD42-67]|nr:radical SAM protein [bacterium 1xD42-67]